ncbi:radical SAM protein [Candidatus Pelagibacter sp.]|nr:radical SAM protein [Candidatus Pelagibacter sp.]
MNIGSAWFNKKRLLEKVRHFHNHLKNNDGKVGTYHRGIELNLNNACNLRCKYCFTGSPKGDHVKDFMPIPKLREIADEADKLGYIEWDLQGGEVLLRPDKLFEALDAIQPERFYLYVTTNGYKVDRKIIKELGKRGVSRMSVSFDSWDPDFHDEMRGRKDSWKRAIQALEYIQEAGMDPYMNVTVGHYNAKSEDLRMLLEYSKKKKYRTLVNVACPTGMWNQVHDVVCDEEDQKHIRKLRKEYKNLNRNLWNPFDSKLEKIMGCTTVNRMYITALGDVLACPYVHIKIGNVFENTLKEISDYGFRIKHFRNHSDKCLAGEDLNFIKKFNSTPGKTIFNPVKADEIFQKEDFVD